MAEKYSGIVRGNRIKVRDVEKALDSKVSLSGDQRISGTKTFEVSPVVPSKDAAVGDNPTAIATEAQVYNAFVSIGTDVDNILMTKGDQEVDGIKTFTSTPKLLETKILPIDNGGGVVAATETQAYKAACW